MNRRQLIVASAIAGVVVALPAMAAPAEVFVEPLRDWEKYPMRLEYRFASRHKRILALRDAYFAVQHNEEAKMAFFESVFGEPFGEDPETGESWVNVLGKFIPVTLPNGKVSLIRTFPSTILSEAAMRVTDLTNNEVIHDRTLRT